MGVYPAITNQRLTFAKTRQYLVEYLKTEIKCGSENKPIPIWIISERFNSMSGLS